MPNSLLNLVNYEGYLKDAPLSQAERLTNLQTGPSYRD